ncbi:unnamed protein product [Rotaria sp. Silwood1]|nr:unnamed protein product [Rotaria sp. Silwood1]CAF1630616.1 unnamed protein product [Rotaria sp. Silwood1]CAF3732871.1 unnamed protein product [Rotaria sp. Silwood1]CAF3784948.1 unnamed protein product [Rotaria sp. Silwood1]CAF3787876.1 unnamed protein product [Rotaria sp. Silwood1]
MMKLIITIFILYTFLLDKNFALDAESYEVYIEELSHNEKFLDEYTKWSLELFSQSDYLYGNSHAAFPCSIEKSTDNISIPTSVHTLRPSDIKCVAAIGDSLTTGVAAHAITPIGLLMENQGISWSVGGDYTYSKIFSLPNILKQYNPQLTGFSTKVSAMFSNNQNATNNRLNVAKSWDRSSEMFHQAELLIDRLKDKKLCDWDNDWKVITLFAGTHDLCNFCEDSNLNKHTPEQYVNYIRATLDKLYNASIPRTLINLVLVLDVRSVKDLSNDNYVCQVLHKKICPCAAFPTVEQAKTLDNYITRYHQSLFHLIASERYEGRDDFSVVIQPFMAKTKLLYKDNHKIDFSYFAPDCFHFSGKGHSVAALSLWNNMLEPVGGKKWSWHIGESLKCPTKEYPYIFTSKNSAKALNELKHTTMSQTTNRVSTISSDTTTSDINSTSHHHHHKHKNSKSILYSNKMKFIIITGLLFIIIMILTISIVRRRKVRVFIPGNERHGFNGVDNSQYHDDNDEVEIWSRTNTKSNYFEKNKTTKSHGTRVFLE